MTLSRRMSWLRRWNYSAEDSIVQVGGFLSSESAAATTTCRSTIGTEPLLVLSDFCGCSTAFLEREPSLIPQTFAVELGEIGA